VGNFVFNLLFIPLWGIAGAALSTVLKQILITVYLVWVLRKEFHFQVFHQIWKIVGATACMAIGITVLQLLHVPVFVSVPVGMILYFGALFVLRESSLMEMQKSVMRRS